MRIPKLDPEFAYIGTSLYLPRKHVLEGPLRGALTFGVNKLNEDRVLLTKHPHHFEVPREALSRKEMRDMGLKVVTIRPDSFPTSSLRPKDGFALRANQEEAWAAFDPALGGVLQLPCGQGKTIMGLFKAASLGLTTLVVSWQAAHLENWERELREFFELDGPVGWIRGSVMDYKREVVFATIQTLVKRAAKGELPEDFSTQFGVVLYDEVHHLAAEDFVKSANLSYGYRFGLTATSARVDRTEGVFFAHLGPLIYQSEEQDLLPTFHVHSTGVELTDEDVKRITDTGGQRNISLLRAWLARHAGRNELIRAALVKDLAEGRKVFVLTHSKEHAGTIAAMFPEAGLITGDTPTAKRLTALNKSSLVVATMDVGKENYNRPDLDTLYLLTPFAARDYAAPALQQAVGRIQRARVGKPHPRVRLWLDDIPECQGLTRSLIAWMLKRNFKAENVGWANKRKKKGW